MVFLKFFNVYLEVGGGESACAHAPKWGRGREGERVSQAVSITTVRTKPNSRREITEIMTMIRVGCSTDWATQAPHKMCFSDKYDFQNQSSTWSFFIHLNHDNLLSLWNLFKKKIILIITLYLKLYLYCGS